MCAVSNNTGPNTGDNFQSETGNNDSDSEKYFAIKTANSKVKLLDILRNYGFKIEPNYQRPIWSNNITCPFPAHKGAKERTPSFGYNFQTDHFCCFGCNKAGRSVEFISEYEEVPRGLVAERILSQYPSDEYIDEELIGLDYQDDLSPLLIDCSKFLQELIKKYKNNDEKLKTIDKMIWWIDFYLSIKAPQKKITKEDLEYRINRLKEVLQDF